MYEYAEPALGYTRAMRLVADRGEKHRDHRDQDGGDHVPTRLLRDHTEHRHRRSGLNHDDAVKHQVAEREAPMQLALTVHARARIAGSTRTDRCSRKDATAATATARECHPSWPVTRGTPPFRTVATKSLISRR